ncbi:phage antirepressor N-terminal domain-containing protein [Laribacter hongkongensis]|uniref:phage antirepressor N-terminal domain-containing protein n=1 Tax=Laribacter hongkongensis TaxID=168471 RepID=UPI001EFCB5BC|nr:phage antirepressor N-terminal domain-containing protein [Laribacter hongkongensis]MCG8997212.1 phage antirepressor N-terminal domain-containing protein [Laribacter hongkongensis]MCG9003329.1 phage antirepressor N-terminal domain-containing protein [Laribacter hongkongensis]MCG9014750.1 phage antirepressor N-terminal domain-containing protein [Laribacter hongkongensis]MCG9018784.1 phage antirepressor N-terminal domain-containing protein [Laribacter hongkongensis]MCG9027596.1 phage antirepre
MTTTQLAAIDFHGAQLTVITTPEGDRLVAMQPICDAIGLHWGAQYNRIRRNEVLSATIFMTKMVAKDGKLRELACLPLDYLNGWLFGIDTNRCREEIRPKLIEYQRECYRALAAYWMDGKPARRAVKGNAPTDVTISEIDAANLHSTFFMVDRACGIFQDIIPGLRLLDSSKTVRMDSVRAELRLCMSLLAGVQKKCAAAHSALSAKSQY